MRITSGWLLIACAPWAVGCGGLLGNSEPPTPAPIAGGADPTPLSKCKIAASSDSPLVTEWPASEKAHLQSLASSRTVAVEFTGCELRIIDGCRLPGQYTWQHTTLATDTVEITNADELYAKLPIGAVGLEGELQRSGQLAVRTTVAGQLRADGLPEPLPAAGGACARATHYVSAISVGAFKLLSGASARAGGGATVVGLGAGASHQSSQGVLREAGMAESCGESTDDAPSSQCASPIQVFLSPLQPEGAPAARSPSQELDAAAIAIQFPKEDDEAWTLRNHRSEILCTLPCEKMVPPVSGFYLQRESDSARLRLPESFPHRPGSHVTAEYQVGRGSPFLSKLTFYGAGIPMAALGVGMTTWGIVQATSDCDNSDPQNDCFPSAGFLFLSGGMFLAFAGASTWWFLWSQEEKVVTHEQLPAAGARKDPGVQVMFGPGGLAGTF